MDPLNPKHTQTIPIQDSHKITSIPTQLMTHASQDTKENASAFPASLMDKNVTFLQVQQPSRVELEAKFYVPVQELLKKYGCSTPEELKNHYSRFDILQILYNAILIYIFKKDKMLERSPQTELQFLYTRINLEAVWNSLGKTKQESLSAQLSFIKNFIEYAKLAKISQDEIRQIQRDLSATSLLTEFIASFEPNQTDPSSASSSLIAFMHALHHNLLDIMHCILKDQFRQIENTTQSIVKGNVSLQLLMQKEGRKNIGAFLNHFQPLHKQIIFIQHYSEKRLRELRLKKDLGISIDQMSPIREFSQLLRHFYLCLQYRSDAIMNQIQKIRLFLSDEKPAQTATLLCDSRFSRYLAELRSAHKFIAEGMAEIIQNLNEQQREKEIVLSVHDLRHIEKALDLQLATLLASQAGELQEKPKCQVSWSTEELSSFYQQISELIEMACSQALLNAKKYRDDMLEHVPPPLQDLLNFSALPEIIAAVKNAFLFSMPSSTVQYSVVVVLNSARDYLHRASSILSVPRELFTTQTTNLIELSKEHGQYVISLKLKQLLDSIGDMSLIPQATYQHFFAIQNEFTDLITPKSVETWELMSTPQHSLVHLRVLKLLVGSIKDISVFQEIINSLVERLLIRPNIASSMPDDHWLDALDCDEEPLVAQTTDSPSAGEHEVDEVDSKEVAALPSSSVAQAALFVLPTPLPASVGGSIELFNHLNTQFYHLPNPSTPPFEAQKLIPGSQHPALRQQNFALSCLQSVVELDRLPISTEQHYLVRALFFFLEHQAIEQGLTHVYTKIHPKHPRSHLPHKITELLKGIALATNYHSAVENDHGTCYFRYPFAYAPSKPPLALLHMLETNKTTIQPITWVKDMIDILSAAMTRDAETDVKKNFSTVIQTLQSHLTQLEGESKQDSVTLKKMFLNKGQIAALDVMSKQRQEVFEALQQKIHTMHSWEPHFRVKVSTLKTIAHHLRCFNISVDLIKNFPHRRFLFLYAWTQQIAIQYLVENIGVFLSIDNHILTRSHNLLDYCQLFQLDSELSDKQQKLLQSINLGKGSEYIYKRFAKPENKLAFGKMKWLSMLYEQSFLEEGFAKGTKKTVETTTLQAQVLESSIELTGLAVTLIKTKLLN